jgi:hypothetical protein
MPEGLVRRSGGRQLVVEAGHDRSELQDSPFAEQQVEATACLSRSVVQRLCGVLERPHERSDAMKP